MREVMRPPAVIVVVVVVVERSPSIESGRPERQPGAQEYQEPSFSGDNIAQTVHELCICRIVMPSRHVGQCPTGDLARVPEGAISVGIVYKKFRMGDW